MGGVGEEDGNRPVTLESFRFTVITLFMVFECHLKGDKLAD